MMTDIKIQHQDPRHPAVIEVLTLHLQTMDDQAPGVPATSQHALDVEALCTPDIEFCAAWVGEELAGVGALKALGGGESELKSMHTRSAFRGKGIGRAMLLHLIEIARRRGDTRVSLETGSQPGFASSRGLYASEGFIECPPFAAYLPDPNSTFMTLAL